MPYIARNPATGQVWTATLTNAYKLTYYGVKYWEDEDEAAAELAQASGEHSDDSDDRWAVLEVEDAQLKRYNVKLKNNPQFTLFTDEAGTAEIRRREG